MRSKVVAFHTGVQEKPVVWSMGTPLAARISSVISPSSRRRTWPAPSHTLPPAMRHASFSSSPVDRRMTDSEENMRKCARCLLLSPRLQCTVMSSFTCASFMRLSSSASAFTSGPKMFWNW